MQKSKTIWKSILKQTVKRDLSQKKKILPVVLAGMAAAAVILTVYLVDCHNQRKKTNGYRIKTIQADSIDESSLPPVVCSETSESL